MFSIVTYLPLTHIPTDHRFASYDHRNVQSAATSHQHEEPPPAADALHFRNDPRTDIHSRHQLVADDWHHRHRGRVL